MSEKDKLNLHDIHDAIEKITKYMTKIKSAAELEKNAMVFDAVLMNIVVIGESVNRLSDSVKDCYQNIEWEKIKGLRNIIAHDYFGIDVEEIWHIVSITMPDFEQQISSILKNFKS